MKIEVTQLTDNKVVLDRARVTVWKEGAMNTPSERFMDNIYMSEHSPIRAKEFLIKIRGIKYWICNHLVRHNIGVTPFVSTQRNDRLLSDIPRDEKGQGELVNIDMVINAQAIINMSKARLCGAAHEETRHAWQMVLDELKKIDPLLFTKAVPICVYRGFCPEMNCCGFVSTKRASELRNNYIGNRPKIR